MIGSWVEQLRPWLENYQPGVPADIELPTDSLVHMFERSVKTLR